MADTQVILFNPDTIQDLYGRIFYGLTYDPATGLANFEQIESGEAIKLPVLEPGSNHETTDYVTWLSSTKYLGFAWESALSSNLIMEVA